MSAALVLSAVLAGAALVDQLGDHSLAEHATAVYAPYGERANPDLLYGLLYTVAGVSALLWLLVLRTLRSHSRGAPALTVVVTAVTGALAVLLLVSTEYGARIFPAYWGAVALLSPVAGAVAVALLRRSGRSPEFTRSGAGSQPVWRR